MKACSAYRLTRRDLIVLPYVALCLCFITYLPVWDGMEYWRCTVAAATHSFNPLRYDCSNHPTMGYMLPVGVLQRFIGPNYASVILVNTLLGTLGVLAFSRILDRLVPGPEWRVERMIATLFMSLFPVFTACTIELTPDFGITVFALCLVFSLLENRMSHAVLFGALTSLSKDTGIAVFASITAAWLVHYVFRADDAELSPFRRLKRHAALLIVPAIMVLDVLSRRIFLGPNRQWHGRGSELALWKQIVSVSFLDSLLPTQLWELLGLNFLWVLTLFVIADGVRGLWRWVCGLSGRPSTEDERAAGFVTLAFILTAFFLTRFRTWVIPRYQLPGVPLLLLVGVRAFWNLKVAPRSRRLMLSVLAVLFTGSNFNTFDGLSIKLFDTVPFGRHRILDLTANTYEPLFTAQMVYNLEFTQLHYLVRDALPVMFANGVCPLGYPLRAGDALVIRIQRDGFARSTSRRDTIEVDVVWLDITGTPKPRVPTLWFLELPQFDEDELRAWRHSYNIGRAVTFSRFGYQLTVVPMHLHQELTPESPHHRNI